MSTVVIDLEVVRDAACRDADPERFRPGQEWPDAARAIRRWCLACPVAVRCHRWAEQNGEFGVWGGRYRTQQTDGEGRQRAYTLAELDAGPKSRCGSRSATPRPTSMQCQRCRRFFRPHGPSTHVADDLCSGCHERGTA